MAGTRVIHGHVNTGAGYGDGGEDTGDHFGDHVEFSEGWVPREHYEYKPSADAVASRKSQSGRNS